MLYIKLFIEREKNIGQSAPECPFNNNNNRPMHLQQVTTVLIIITSIMNSGSPGGICMLPLLCEKNLSEPPLGVQDPLPPSAYAPGGLCLDLHQELCS